MSFADAVDALFENPYLGVDGVFRAGGTGGGVPVRVIFAQPDVILDGLGDARLRARSVRLDLRTAEVAAPKPGDTVTVGATVYTLRGQPLADSERLTWKCEASTS